MLRQFVQSAKSRLVVQIRNQSTVSNAENTKWDLFVGVQIERLPIITKTLNKMEREYQDLLSQLEFEKSYKSDFEIREEREKARATLLKEGKIKMDLDAVAQQTAVDLKDLWKNELSKFQPAPRITEADQKNDLKSTERKLEYSLTLIKEQKLGNDNLFLLPQGKLLSGETLYDAAQRVIVELCGNGIKTAIYGKAPCGFYKYKYPAKIRGETDGAKVFFYRAILKSGQVDAKLGNFEWLDRTELLDKVDKYSNYKKSISKFII